MKRTIAGVVLAMAVACSGATRTEDGKDASLLRGAEVLWAVETKGIVLQMRAYPDGDSAILRTSSGPIAIGGNANSLERRGTDGVLRWQHDFPEGRYGTAWSARMTLAPDGTAFVMYMVTSDSGWGSGFGTWRLAAVDPGGVLMWDVPVAYGMAHDIAAEAGGAVALVAAWGTDGVSATLWTLRYGPDGVVGAQQQVAQVARGAWTYARLDPTGSVVLASESRLEKRGPAGDLEWAHDVPAAEFRKVLVAPDGGIVATGSSDRDFTWGAGSFHYVPDAFFNPLDFLAALSADGTVRWLVAGRAPVGAGTGGRVYVAEYDSCWTGAIRAYDAAGAIAWTRSVAFDPAREADARCAFGVQEVESSLGTVRVSGWADVVFRSPDEAVTLRFGDASLWRGGGFAGVFREPTP